jgi:hypothetical protein
VVGGFPSLPEYPLILVLHEAVSQYNAGDCFALAKYRIYSDEITAASGRKPAPEKKPWHRPGLLWYNHK